MAIKKKAANKKAGKKKVAANARHDHAPTHDHGDVDTSNNPHGEGYELWDFLPAFVHPAGVHGTSHDYEAADADYNESQCGGADDSQPVEQYDGNKRLIARPRRPGGA